MLYHKQNYKIKKIKTKLKTANNDELVKEISIIPSLIGTILSIENCSRGEKTSKIFNKIITIKETWTLNIIKIKCS